MTVRHSFAPIHSCTFAVSLCTCCDVQMSNYVTDIANRIAKCATASFDGVLKQVTLHKYNTQCWYAQHNTVTAIQTTSPASAAPIRCSNMSTMFNTDKLTDSLGEIVAQLASPIDQRISIAPDSVSSYLNLAQCSDDAAVQPLLAQAVTTSNNQYKLQCSQTKPIARFTPSVKDAPGEHTQQNFSLSRALSKALNNGSVKASLGRAAVRGQNFLVGTDDEAAAQHFLVLVSGEILARTIMQSPILAFIQVPEHVRDIRWVAPTLAVAAIGKGLIQLYTISTNPPAITPLGPPLTSLHTDYIRELAPHPLLGSVVASVAQDGVLNIADFNRLSDSAGLVQRRTPLHTTVSSVRWPMYNQSVCVSVTTDSGVYHMYDTRTAAQQPVVACDTHHLALPPHFTSHVSTDAAGAVTTNPSTAQAQLYTHERYTDHHVLLGYSNGVIKHIDMRNTRAYVDVIQDPYVEGIGSIEYNCRSKSCLVSGYTDFTVWKHEPSGNARVWSHSISGTDTLINQVGYSTNATFFDDDTVLVTDSTGGVSLRIQGFN